MNQITQLQQIINHSQNIVFFGGAGVSTESGIPDFRSQDGLFHQVYDYPPEEILSRTFFHQHPDVFYRFYRDKILIDGIEPNAAHLKLAELEQSGKLNAVITQNIDGLHQKAGSLKVFELHGSILRNYCMSCHTCYSIEAMREMLYPHNSHSEPSGDTRIPRCSCGGLIKPDVVLYEESLDNAVIHQSVQALQSADTLIIGGTSMLVYPAAGLIRYFRGSHIVVINRDSIDVDEYADLVIRDRIAETFSKIVI